LAELGVVGKAAVLDAFAQGGEGSGESADVLDPFGGDDDDYEEAYRTLEELVGKVLHQLEPMLAP
jgi:protein-tyrosine-phosphatase